MSRSAGPERYPESYFLEDCGGAEFFRLYGPRIPKPQVAYSLRRACLSRGMRVVDVGCGRGELLFQARQAGAAAVGTDFAGAALSLARESSGCAVLLCDARRLPFADASFDRVFFIGVMDHLSPPELERCFSEFARVLRLGGFVVVHTCVNREYLKIWTYGARRSLAQAGRRLGLEVADPSPPRDEKDAVLHINEHSAGDLRSFFRRLGWTAHVEVRPNYKLEVEELYPSPLPPDFPMRPAPGWKRHLHRLFFRPPLDRILGRELFAIARPPAGPGATVGAYS